MVVRLYLNHALTEEQLGPLSQEHAHYLFGVMRLGVGAQIEVFNGSDGAWSAEVIQAAKRKGTLRVAAQIRPQRSAPDLWLLFAPIKKARTDFIVEKATELGASRICPVQTDWTNSERIRRDRLQAHAVEAAEQCGGTFVPEVRDLERLDKFLEGWDPARLLVVCDEVLVSEPVTAFDVPPPAAILIGPEGGFSPSERARFDRLSFARRLSLGPRVLRADTAAVAALTLWQAQAGDWR